MEKKIYFFQNEEGEDRLDAQEIRDLIGYRGAVALIIELQSILFK